MNKTEFFEFCVNVLQKPNGKLYLNQLKESYGVDEAVAEDVSYELRRQVWGIYNENEGNPYLTISSYTTQCLAKYGGSYRKYWRAQRLQTYKSRLALWWSRNFEKTSVVIAAFALTFTVYQHFAHSSDVEKLEREIQELKTKIAENQTNYENTNHTCPFCDVFQYRITEKNNNLL